MSDRHDSSTSKTYPLQTEKTEKISSNQEGTSKRSHFGSFSSVSTTTETELEKKVVCGKYRLRELHEITPEDRNAIYRYAMARSKEIVNSALRDED